MHTPKQFRWAGTMLTTILYDSGMELKILAHWRTYEPTLVEELLAKQMLRKALTQKADDLIDLQITLEKTEHLPAALAAMEAWRVMMKPVPPDQGVPSTLDS